MKPVFITYLGFHANKTTPLWHAPNWSIKNNLDLQNLTFLLLKCATLLVTIVFKKERK